MQPFALASIVRGGGSDGWYTGQPPFRFEGIGRSAFYAKAVLRLLYQAGLASA
jgi:hypothetical protein